MARKKDDLQKKAKSLPEPELKQSGTGAIATDGGVATGQGGVAAGQINGPVNVNNENIQQFFIGTQPSAAMQPKAETPLGSLPAGSNIPFPRNALFTGREKDLELIAESLLGKKLSSMLISQAITGMGGIGKTQLAVEFAYQYGYKFEGVHWLNLASPESLDSEIAGCGRAMGLTYDDQREQVAETMKLWQNGGLRLLILDNFEAVGKANDILTRLQGANMRLLITSRRNDWSKELGLHPLSLELFSEKESLNFLEKSLEKQEKEVERKALAEKLGLLPLALELAAKYININKTSIKEYTNNLDEILAHESMGAEWFNELEITTPTKHELSLFATFELSRQEVKDEVQQNVFRVSGYCAPNTPIPLELLTQTLELDDKQVNTALFRLNSLGLLNTDGLPTIHPLLAAFARSTNKGNELLEKLADKLTGLAKQANDQIDQTGSLQWFAPFRLHVLSVGDHAENAKIQDAANLLGNLGYYLRIIADYDEAKHAYERALKIDEAVYGPDHPDVATLVNNLGAVLQELGDLEGAKNNAERALKIDEATYGLDHPNIAIDVNNLGMVLKEMGDLEGAKNNFGRALSINEATYGLDHPSVAILVNNLGMALQELGDLEGAKNNFGRALKIDEATYGLDHPNIAIRANNLGTVLQQLGDLEGAKQYFERSLKIDEAAYGLDHPKVAIDVNNLGGLLSELGDMEGARKNVERALKIFKKFLPDGHPKIKIVEENLQTLED